ncbi:MAG TPA: TRAP transporter TatT component family protein [Anaeromyxobacteraceae bacterium]|nr:TRAP transporter TatT component family protein [Anaeromyxobacteraceae bacterium]
MTGAHSKRIASLAALLAASSLGGCKTVAVRSLADALSSGGGDAYASDDDPDLVRAAIPFGLKTMEGVLPQEPRHVGLLTSLVSGFTSYSYAFVAADADLADLDGRVADARQLHLRAKKLFLRARAYGLRGLDVRHAGMDEALRGVKDVPEALAAATKQDVPLLYWTASAWALAIAHGKDDMQLVAELPAPVAMMERALALDEAWGAGALHEFFVTYDATRSAPQGGGPERARAHMERALQLCLNQKLGPHVAWAEGVLVQTQNRPEFTRVLEDVLRADPEAWPKYRLANVLAQRRARELLAHADDLFL